MEKRAFVAVDYGASGGKMAAAEFDGKKLLMKKYLTCPNRPVELAGTLYWDLFSLYNSILNGLGQYRRDGIVAKSLGIDAWGATYGFLDKWGRLLEPVYHYRDKRTAATMDALWSKVSRKELFEMTGCQCNRTYTLPQLYACTQAADSCLENAKTMLFLPDLLGYFLTGIISTERTIAGTSALLKPGQEDWSREVFKRCGIPMHFLTEIVDAGTVVGTVIPKISESVGIKDLQLAATIGHDSAAAVAAIPGFGPNKLYISIGTNVSMGIERDTPLVTEKAYVHGMKNTGGMEGKKIVYRDFSAFWIINELRAVWKAQGDDYSFDDLQALARQSKSKLAFVDPEDARLNAPGGNMREKMTNCLRDSRQAVPETVGEWVLCVFESITLKIKYVAELFGQHSDRPLEAAYIINGGSRNALLVQFISDALGIQVMAGMPYATLTGNLLGQLLADGKAENLSQLREISANTFAMEEYLPQKERDWNGLLEKAIQHGVGF